MNDMQRIPAAPPDRDLPNPRRIREELLMKINPEDRPASLRRSWGLPLGVAASVAVVSVAAVRFARPGGSRVLRGDRSRGAAGSSPA